MHIGASPLRACRCSPDVVARYQSRLSGPLLNRIDLQVEVPAVAPDVLTALPDGESSSAVAARVAVARDRQLARQGCSSALLDSNGIDKHIRAEPSAVALLQTAAARLGWSARGQHRLLRVARTIADLAGADLTRAAHVAEAIQYRRVLSRG